ADYYSGITDITVNGKNAYELKGKFLDDLHKNAFSDKHRVVVFPISLVGNAWRCFDETKGSIKWNPTNPEFEKWLASKFVNYMTMDIFTKGALWDYWKLGRDEIKPTNDETSVLEETNHDNK
ncbi:hypothetical protein Tco_0342536, partial [Tanacetum coccineum]